MLKTKIFAGRIANLTDARYFAAAGAEWLSFCCDPTDKFYLPMPAIAAIRAWVECPKTVGSFGFQTADEIRAVAKAIQLEAIQLEMFAPIETLSALQDFSIVQEIILQKESSELELELQLEEKSQYVEFFILNFQKNNISYEDLKNKKPFSTAFLKNMNKKYAVIWDIDLSEKNVAEVIEQFQPSGLYLSGGEEEQTGMKSFDDLDEILERLEC